jgi:hypothetical protein
MQHPRIFGRGHIGRGRTNIAPLCWYRRGLQKLTGYCHTVNFVRHIVRTPLVPGPSRSRSLKKKETKK